MTDPTISHPLNRHILEYLSIFAILALPIQFLLQMGIIVGWPSLLLSITSIILALGGAQYIPAKRRGLSLNEYNALKDQYREQQKQQQTSRELQSHYQAIDEILQNHPKPSALPMEYTGEHHIITVDCHTDERDQQSA